MKIKSLLQFNTKTKSRGFTLIETLIAIIILALAIDAILTLVASGITTVKYSRNQIIATALAQESLEYIRNDRDTYYQKNLPWTPTTWNNWLARFNVNTSGQLVALATPAGCFLSSKGCYIDQYTTAATQIFQCSTAGTSTGCPLVTYYSGSGFYGYRNTYPASIVTLPSNSVYDTTFSKKITMQQVAVANTSEVIVTVRIDWKNGTQQKTFSQSIVISDWTTS